jgi:DNA-binding PadR family transcriptional regulator
MPIDDDLFDKLRIELRRGSLILAVLGALREERYGYTLRQSLEDAGLPIEEGALYPLLRRLETQGLLTSEWREDARRNKRFYRLSPEGEMLLTQLLAEWNDISASILRLTGKD